MAAMEREIASVGGLVGLVERSIGGERLGDRGRQLSQQPIELRCLDQAVEHGGDQGSGLRLRARAVSRLARRQHAAESELDRAQGGGLTAGVAPGRLHVVERADRGLGRAAEVEPLRAELGGQAPRLRTEGRDRERDGIVRC